jgi:hypothetical protein
VLLLFGGSFFGVTVIVEGYHIEGVCSGANGHYYAILRTNEPTSKNIVSEVTKLTQDARKP